ncbi:unnamed protein product [Prorocentrum cordatum]|uniref:JmjC domain-containing protein n=1 Tax=Prorocentrum cordatum TaxID=2364126 RepID=A0ABN9U3Q5_9DINO|nr:unnamed protein product [Polarella glacialis]
MPRLDETAPLQRPRRKNAAATVPECDGDALEDVFQKAQPVVLKRFASEWPLAGQSLAAVVCPGEGEEDAVVEVQAACPGDCHFRGYAGVLERAPLSSLPALAARASGSLYLVQCPIWARGNPAACPLKHLLPRVRSSYFSLSAGRRGGGSRRLESVNLWVSVGTTHSNLHYDSEHGLLVVLRGTKRVELFEPQWAPSLGAFPVSDPLRAHHATAAQGCLAARLGCAQQGACGLPGSSPCPSPRVHAALGHQAVLSVGDALFIPEGWWHHVHSTGTRDPSAGGRPVALAANFWWRGHEREPESAQPYVLRRILSEMLMRRTGAPSSEDPVSCLELPDIISEVVAAARSSSPPLHAAWRRPLRAHGRRLPQAMAAALGGAGEAPAALRAVLDGLDALQASLLLSALEGAAAAAALRRVWRLYPQDSGGGRGGLCSSRIGSAWMGEEKVEGEDVSGDREASSRNACMPAALPQPAAAAATLPPRTARRQLVSPLVVDDVDDHGELHELEASSGGGTVSSASTPSVGRVGRPALAAASAALDLRGGAARGRIRILGARSTSGGRRRGWRGPRTERDRRHSASHRRHSAARRLRLHSGADGGRQQGDAVHRSRGVGATKHAMELSQAALYKAVRKNQHAAGKTPAPDDEDLFFEAVVVSKNNAENIFTDGWCTDCQACFCCPAGSKFGWGHPIAARQDWHCRRNLLLLEMKPAMLEKNWYPLGHIFAAKIDISGLEFPTSGDFDK